MARRGLKGAFVSADGHQGTFTTLANEKKIHIYKLTQTEFSIRSCSIVFSPHILVRQPQNSLTLELFIRPVREG